MTVRLKRFSILTAPLDQEDSIWLSKNYPELEKDYDHECPTCGKNNGAGKNGSIVVNGETVECNCRAQVQMQRHYLAAGIGAKYHRLGWNDWCGDAQAMSAVQSYIADFKRYAVSGIGLYIHSDPGHGKTMLACIVAKECVKRGYSTYVVTASSYASMVRAGWRDNEIRAYITKKAETSKVLIIDDLGSEQSDEGSTGFQDSHSRKVIEELLRNRTQANQITIFTSNLPPATVQSVYGKRFSSLLFEATRFISVGGEDFRKTGRCLGEGLIV